jgi:hypothetical protein
MCVCMFVFGEREREKEREEEKRGKIECQVMRSADIRMSVPKGTSSYSISLHPHSFICTLSSSIYIKSQHLRQFSLNSTNSEE